MAAIAVRTVPRVLMNITRPRTDCELAGDGESHSALQAAQVHGTSGALEPALEAQWRRILGTLVKLSVAGAARRTRAAP